MVYKMGSEHNRSHHMDRNRSRVCWCRHCCRHQHYCFQNYYIRYYLVADSLENKSSNPTECVHCPDAAEYFVRSGIDGVDKLARTASSWSYVSPRRHCWNQLFGSVFVPLWMSLDAHNRRHPSSLADDQLYDCTGQNRYYSKSIDWNQNFFDCIFPSGVDSRVRDQRWLVSRTLSLNGTA